jgi:hypothetical protein
MGWIMMIEFENALSHKPIWVNPTAVIVMEADTVASVRLVLTNGGYIRVVGQPAQVMVSLSESRTFREDR